MGYPKGVADILPLTTTQKGILYHSIDHQAVAGQYVAVVTCRIDGALDPDRFRASAEAVIAGSDAFRSGFVWSGVKQPVQVVRDAVSLPWVELDWQGVDDIEDRLDALMELEKARQFNLKSAPLMAMTLIRLSGTSWQLVWTAHHLVSDGWSTQVALNMMMQHYSTGNLPRITGIKPYLSWLKAQAPVTDKVFWTTYLSDLTAPCVLPASQDTQAPKLDRLDVRLGTALLQDVKTFARTQHVTVHAVLATSWALILRRFLGCDDVVFGETNAGRPAEIPGMREALGAFINTLPVRLRIEAGQSVADLIQTYARQSVDLHAHAHASLADVQACAPLPSGTALFDTLFVNEAVSPSKIEHGELVLSEIRSTQPSNYPLACLVTPHSDFKVELYVDTSKLSQENAVDLVDQYRQVLKAVIARPEAAIKDLLRPLDWDVPLTPATEAQDVVERILAQARTRPNSLAVSDETGGLTYQELIDRAGRIANALQSAGVSPDDLVPVALPRGCDSLAAFLGVMMAGAGYVPMDLDYPQHRLSQMLDSVRPGVVIVSEGTKSQLPAYGEAIVLIGEAVQYDPIAEPISGSRAYVIFTSGSTDRPKGVEISRSALSLSTGARDSVYGTVPDAYLLLSSLSFDSSVAGIYWTLATGGHLVIAPTRIEQSPNQLGALIAQHQITHTLCLPSLALALLKSVPTGMLGSVRTLIAAGEPLPAMLVAEIAQTLPNCRLINEYGPTEATVWCTSFDATGFDDADSVPIGSAIPGTWVGVVDRDDLPLPAGTEGEIIVAGATVSRGYLADPDQTSARFFTLGRGSVPAYRTGDLGRYDAQGRLFFLGRKDRQVKIRGHRIELSEIDAQAQAAAGDTSVAVCALTESADTFLIVALDCEAEDPICADVAQSLTTKLPAAFQPRQVVGVGSFPRLPNGKLDQARLEKMVMAQPKPPARPEAADDLEALLITIFSDVVGRDCSGRDTNFFDLGGDSLMTIAAHLKAEDQAIRFEPQDLFSHPTPALLAQRVTERLNGTEGSDARSELLIANAKGAKPPLALVEGSIPLFRSLVQELGPEQPIAFLPSLRLPHQPVPVGKTIEDLAAANLQMMNSVRPDAVWTLCGFSVGCPIAMEMAHQLGPRRAQALALLDPPFKMIGAEPACQPLYFQSYKRARYLLRGWKLRRKAAKAGWPVPQNDDQHWHEVDRALLLAVTSYRVPKLALRSEIVITSGNPALVKGDTLDTHLPNKTVTELGLSHVDLINRPEGRTQVAERLKDLMSDPE